MLLATTPFAANPFLGPHAAVLATFCSVSLCTNTLASSVSNEFRQCAKVFHVDFERRISPLRDIRSFFQTFLLLRRERPDAIHSITPKAGLIAMAAGFLARIPHRHHTFTGQIWANRRGLGRIFLKLFDRVIAGFSTQLFADSVSQCHFLEQENIVGAGKITVLGPGSMAGVNLDRFKSDLIARHRIRELIGISESTCLFLFVGRLTKDKGIEDLLLAFDKVFSMNADVALCLIGPDEEGLSERVQQAHPHVHWFGEAQTPERYMAAADVLILPSYREGFGSVIIEAAACGIPTIAYRINGVIDAVDEGVTGILVIPGEIDSLAMSMHDLSDGELSRVVLGKRARSRVEENYSSKVVSAAWLNFYRKVLSQKDSGDPRNLARTPDA